MWYNSINCINKEWTEKREKSVSLSTVERFDRYKWNTLRECIVGIFTAAGIKVNARTGVNNAVFKNGKRAVGWLYNLRKRGLFKNYHGWY